MQLDRTLLVFDYLNGEPVACLDRGVPDPIGPSGAAAAFDREAFLSAGGFDENLFAYWEDVDLVLRMRLEGRAARWRRAPPASTTTRPRSGPARRRKNYLTGFGRGYVLRKWGVLRSPRPAGAGSRNGRRGLRWAVGRRPQPRRSAGQGSRVPGRQARRAVSERGACGGGRRGRDAAHASAAGVEAGAAPGTGGVSRGNGKPRVLTVFHVAEVSGPLRALTYELRWLAAVADLTVVVPAPGPVADELGDLASVQRARLRPLDAARRRRRRGWRPGSAAA